MQRKVSILQNGYAFCFAGISHCILHALQEKKTTTPQAHTCPSVLASLEESKPGI